VKGLNVVITQDSLMKPSKYALHEIFDGIGMCATEDDDL
jgi:hypothetical protein